MRFSHRIMALWACAFAVAFTAPQALSQSRWVEIEKKALAEPFKGVTADGTVTPDLYGIQSTGVSTEPVKVAAEEFLAGLTEAQRGATQYGVDDDEWRKWMNIHRYARQGVSFEEMSEDQRKQAIALLRAGLSARGLKVTQDIMKLNHTLGELNNNFEEYGEFLYWLTVMGTPSSTEPWGWQLDGHHLIINYFVLGDQVVMTPTFIGSEPVIAHAGKYKGVRVMQPEQDKGFAFMSTLTEEQRAKAVIAAEKNGNNNLTEAWKDNAIVPVAGIAAKDLTHKQQHMLEDLIAEYIGYMDDGHAKVKMSEVMPHFDATHFAWVGAVDPNGVFYYRIHSPVVLIEFDHQMPANLPGERVPNREHIHAVIRTPNGNDYGKDLLRDHYEAHKNDPNHRHE